MNIKNFDLNLLVVFRALFEERNVTKASKKIGITQPAMSNALNRLRYLVKDDLFIRGPKGMRPTPRANELSFPINSALNNLELSLSSINFDPSTTKKSYRISMSDDVAPLILPNLSKFLEKNSPESSLEIRSEQGSEALKLLDNNEIDYAIGRFETVSKRFGSKNLFSEKPEVEITVYDEKKIESKPVMNTDEVFHVPKNIYNYDQAKALCKAYDSRLATFEEVQKAYQDGAEWCTYGWSEGQFALYPTQTKTWKKLQQKQQSNDNQ